MARTPCTLRVDSGRSLEANTLGRTLGANSLGRALGARTLGAVPFVVRAEQLLCAHGQGWSGFDSRRQPVKRPRGAEM